MALLSWTMLSIGGVLAVASVTSFRVFYALAKEQP